VMCSRSPVGTTRPPDTSLPTVCCQRSYWQPTASRRPSRRVDRRLLSTWLKVRWPGPQPTRS